MDCLGMIKSSQFNRVQLKLLPTAMVTATTTTTSTSTRTTARTTFTGTTTSTTLTSTTTTTIPCHPTAAIQMWKTTAHL